MKLQRRDMLKLGLLQALTLAASRSQANEPEEELPSPTALRSEPSILQGATDDTQTQISIVYDKTVDLEIYATDSRPGRILPDKILPIQFAGHPLQSTKVYFSGLQPNVTYELHIVDRRTQKVLDRRFFSTLDLEKPKLNFAICSCMKDALHLPEIWNQLHAQRPEVIFFVGDTVYADQEASTKGAEPAKLWKRFCESRQVIEIYFIKNLIPILATWDDHDFGRNDGTMFNYPHVKESQKNFLSFFAQDEAYCNILVQGPGVSSAFILRKHLFILFDDRSYREQKGSKGRYAHWGEEQEKWALQLMRSHEGTTWLMNGSQYFPKIMFKETVAGNHPYQFNPFLEQLKLIESKVVFVSGDVHYSEVSRLEPALVGYETYEITSSAMHNRNLPGVPDIIPNRRRITGTGQKNFVMVYSDPQNFGSQFRVTSLNPKGDIMFSLDLSI